MGSPLYAHLLRRAAADVEVAGPCWALLAEHVAPGRADALALRLMAAVHRLVLLGEAPRLARHYPSVGGRAGIAGAWQAFRAVCHEQSRLVEALLPRPCQTNEVGRSAPLAVGFLEIAARTRLALRCLEVGASAGLNLRWDHFHYGGGGQDWGDPSSPVDLRSFWTEPLAPPDVIVEVAERRGCDPSPVDPLTEEGRLTLRAAVWADQSDRFQRLEGALKLAERVPATVDEASLDEWVAAQLVESWPGQATVVYHSVVEEYLATPVRQRFHAALERAGTAATPDAPVAWLRLEPATALRSHALRLTTWPGGDEHLLALSGAHGTDVRRPPAS